MARKRGKQRKQGPNKAGVPASRKTHPPWEVHLTATAEAAYRQIAAQAQAAVERGELTSAHYKTLRMVDEVLDTIIPHDPLARKHALAGTLSNIFRCSKGRMRIYWIASSEQRRVSVLFISDTPRKEGDVNDPYKVFGAIVMSGRFDEIFDKLGVTRPGIKVSGGGDPSILQ